MTGPLPEKENKQLTKSRITMLNNDFPQNIKFQLDEEMILNSKKKNKFTTKNCSYLVSFKTFSTAVTNALNKS